jgi:lipopolysaccharide cholinephosphotransferase
LSDVHRSPQPSLEELQDSLLRIYKEFKRLCDAHDIPYFAMAGTAIGAVRHGGFIPWDDDIDIMMRREDFLRFKQVAPPAHSRPRYRLFDPADDPLYIKPFPSFADTHTVCVDRVLRHQRRSEHHALSIDLFILENVPDNLPAYHRFAREVWIRTKLFYIALTPRPNIPPQYAKYGKPLKATLYCAHYLLGIPPIRKALSRSLNRAYQRYFRQTQHRELLADPALEEYRFTDEDLFPARLLPFEDSLMPVPRENDAHLRLIYGDYLKLPPVEARKTHPSFYLELPPSP